jgi:hypothetical protein
MFRTLRSILSYVVCGCSFFAISSERGVGSKKVGKSGWDRLKTLTLAL